MLAMPGRTGPSGSTPRTRTATSRSSSSSAARGLGSPPPPTLSSSHPAGSRQQQYRVHGEDNASKQMFLSLASRHHPFRLIKLDLSPVFLSFMSSFPFGATFGVGSSLLQPASSLFPPSPSLSLLFPIIPFFFLISFIHSFIPVLVLTIVDDCLACNG